MKGTKKRVVWVYMRRSGDQQHESLGRQEGEILADEVVTKADEIVRPFFIDDAVSGTLSLEQRKGGTQLLAAVKTEFRSYGQVLAHVKKKLQEASNTVDKVEIRKRVMERALRAVESASPSEAAALLGAADEEIMEEADDLAVATGAS